MSNRPRTAIFPVAGKGTRMRPATLAVPKELLPVVDTPLIDFAIDEAIEAGCGRLVFVNHPDKTSIQTHVLAQHGDRAEIVFVDQTEQRGLGHAVLCARDVALPFGVPVEDFAGAARMRVTGVALEPGQPAYRALERAAEEARHRGTWVLATGALYLVGALRHATEPPE